eukprot:6177764-Pleurochrysis_carterae.AAC.3
MRRGSVARQEHTTGVEANWPRRLLPGCDTETSPCSNVFAPRSYRLSMRESGLKAFGDEMVLRRERPRWGVHAKVTSASGSGQLLVEIQQVVDNGGCW